MDLSVIVPSRNEMFLAQTIKNIVERKRGSTEVIAVCDGQWADPPIEDHPDVTLLYYPEAIGQRAATNEAAKISRAKYIMKCDAHCSFDEGFDVKMMEVMQDDWTMVPIMYNLHAFNWHCLTCDNETYQGPTPTVCEKCQGTNFERKIYWREKRNPTSTSYCFDPEPHFQYFGEFKKRPEYKGKDLTETMSLQGSCWMLTRDKYWELDICDEAFGSWGSQGIEVAVKTWLSGGRVLCNHRTWYAHMFRTQGGDFGFPWPASGRQIDKAKKYAKDLFFNNKFPKQVRPLSWLVQKFWPVPGWTDQDLLAITQTTPVEVPVPSAAPKSYSPKSSPTKGLVFYTDNQLDPVIINTVMEHLKRAANGYGIVSVSHQPIDLGTNIVLQLQRGHLSMAKQQLAGLEALNTDIAFMVEHDVIYPKNHFAFTPPQADVFYYNLNWWKVRNTDGQALHFKARQVSGLCAYRDILIEYFHNRVRMIESGEIGGRRHFEPDGSRSYRDAAYGKLTAHKAEDWFSEIPCVDIRHKSVVTRNIFDPSGYRGQVKDWTMADEVPFWGKSKERFPEFLAETLTIIS